MGRHPSNPANWLQALLAVPNHGDDIDGVDLLGIVVLLEEALLGGQIETPREASPVVAVVDVPLVAGPIIPWSKTLAKQNRSSSIPPEFCMSVGRLVGIDGILPDYLPKILD